MSDNKRSVEPGSNSNKRVKLDKDNFVDSYDDIFDQLKTQIKNELVDLFDSKFQNLTNQYNELKEKYDALEKLVKDQPPPLPPRGVIASNISASEVSLRPNSSHNSTPVIKADDEDKSKENKPKHTFGGTSFTFATATPNNSFKANEETPKDSTSGIHQTPKDNKEGSPGNNRPKPVFGSSTSFGSSTAGDFKPRKNVFDELPSSNDTAASTSNSASSFGSNTKFASAFQNSLHKKSFLDDGNNKEEEDDHEDSTQEIAVNTQSYKQVNLEPVKSTTGEEDEKSHFNATCKLFELNLKAMSEGWKERGLGSIHLNQSVTDPKKVRLVMRSNGLLRVILNSQINSSTELFKGLEASLTPGKYLRFNSVKDGNPIQYLLKFGNQNLRDDLVEKIDNLKEQM